MAKIDWSRAQPKKPSEPMNGADLMPSTPRVRIPKQQIREQADRLVREFQAKRAKQNQGTPR